MLTLGNTVAMKSARSEPSKNLPLPSSSVQRSELIYSPGKLAIPLLLSAFDSKKKLRYNIFGSAATAIGSLTCGWCVQYLLNRAHWDNIRAYRAIFWAYAGFGLLKFLLACCLSDKCEVIKKNEPNGSRATSETAPLLQDSTEGAEASRPEELPKKKKKHAFAEMSRRTWGILFQLLPLFAVDSFASGLVPL
jgi:MFS family permease